MLAAAAAGVSYNSFGDEYLAGYGLAKLDDAPMRRVCRRQSPPAAAAASAS